MSSEDSFRMRSYGSGFMELFVTAFAEPSNEWNTEVAMNEIFFSSISVLLGGLESKG